MRRLVLLLNCSRPISWVNTAYPFVAGYLVTLGFDWRVVIGGLYFLIPYNLLMYGINDVFDYESDLQNPRKGGVEGAKVPKPMHRFVVMSAILVNLPFLAYLFFQGSWSARAVLAFVIFMVIAYSAPKLRFKERAGLDSVTSSIHFVGPLVYALTLTGWHNSYWPFVAAFFLWGMASHAFGAVQDIIPDRAAGIGSIGTVIGARYTVWFSIELYIASAVLLIRQGIASLAIAACVLLYVVNILPFRHLTDEQAASANAGWRRFLWLNYVTGAVVTITLILTFFH